MLILLAIACHDTDTHTDIGAPLSLPASAWMDLSGSSYTWGYSDGDRSLTGTADPVVGGVAETVYRVDGVEAFTVTWSQGEAGLQVLGWSDAGGAVVLDEGLPIIPTGGRLGEAWGAEGVIVELRAETVCSTPGGADLDCLEVAITDRGGVGFPLAGVVHFAQDVGPLDVELDGVWWWFESLLWVP